MLKGGGGARNKTRRAGLCSQAQGMISRVEIGDNVEANREALREVVREE